MKLLATLAAGAAALAATSASAANFSFAGTLPSADTILFFDFTVGAPSTVTLVSYSYAGGTQANGNTVTRGGFDPYLSLYNANTGAFLSQDDDGSTVVDPNTGNSWDVRFVQSLAAGNYTVALTAFSLRGSGASLDRSNPSAAFTGTGNLNGRTSNFAFDVLGVDASTGPGAVPEPATWAMMLAGFGVVGATMRRRRSAATVNTVVA